MQLTIPKFRVWDSAERPPSAASANRLAFLDSYRLLAIIMVIGIHSFAYVDLEPSAERVLRFVVQTIAVQIFFMVDGFLFAGKQDSHKGFKYWTYIKKSGGRLLVPWIVFSLIYSLFRYAFEVIGAVDGHLIHDQPFGSTVEHIYASIIAPQLYFLLSLFFIRCTSFWTRRLIAFSIPLLISIFGLYSLVYWGIDPRRFFLPGQDPLLHAFWGFQYYLFGMLLWRLNSILSKRASIVILVALGLAVSIRLLMAYMPQTPEVVSRAAAFMVQFGYLLGTFYLFYKFAPNPTFLSRAGKYNMGIYLLHAPVVLKISALLTELILESQLAGYVATIGVCFFFSLGLTYLLRTMSIGRWMLGETISKPSALKAVHST